MKGAMWALGIFLLSIFALVLINLFGNITVTDQQNYLLMKNAVEAAMYDSIDVARYRNGFCLCTKNRHDGVYNFNSSSEYIINDPVNSSCVVTNDEYKYCELLGGETKIKKEVFAESLVRRFSETIKGNKNYRIVIQDIIEYPPKVSVEVKSYDAFNLFKTTKEEFELEDFSISNQIDAILEQKER